MTIHWKAVEQYFTVVPFDFGKFGKSTLNLTLSGRVLIVNCFAPFQRSCFRVKATLTSHMDLHNFPMDVQTLRIQIAACMYNNIYKLMNSKYLPIFHP